LYNVFVVNIIFYWAGMTGRTVNGKSGHVE